MSATEFIEQPFFLIQGQEKMNSMQLQVKFTSLIRLAGGLLMFGRWFAGGELFFSKLLLQVAGGRCRCQKVWDNFVPNFLS